jgi:predicted enzyme related to lactoylglutathione lyase
MDRPGENMRYTLSLLDVVNRIIPRFRSSSGVNLVNYTSILSRQKFLILVSAFALSLISACSTVTEPISSSISLSEQPLTGKFVWHDLLTDDPVAAREFYSALFDWEFEDTTLPGRSGPYTLIKSQGRYLGGIVMLADPDENTNYSRWLSYLSVDDIDKTTSVVEDEGGTILVPAQDIGNFGRAAVVQDPQSAVLGLVRSKVGDPDDSHVPEAGDIVWHELVAADDIAVTGFYQTLAGYKVRTVDRRGGQYHILEAAGVKRAGIIQNPIRDLPPAWLVSFAVTEPLETASLVESFGGKVLLAPSEEFRENTVALVSDPSGALLLIQKWPL